MRIRFSFQPAYALRLAIGTYMTSVACRTHYLAGEGWLEASRFVTGRNSSRAEKRPTRLDSNHTGASKSCPSDFRRFRQDLVQAPTYNEFLARLKHPDADYDCVRSAEDAG